MSLPVDLNELARHVVGDGKKPNLYFVNQWGKVVAVSWSKEAAVAAAKALGEAKGVLVEDRLHGEVWANDRYRRSQQAGSEEQADRIGSGAR
jgi:hypothetical protein